MNAIPLSAAFWAERLLNGVPAGIAIASLAWIFLRLAGKKNSSTRFAVWFSALLATGAAPFLAGLASRPAGAAANSAEIRLPNSWAVILLGIWAALAALALFRVALGLWKIRNLRAHHPALDLLTLDPLLQKTLAEFRVSRSVTLAISGELRVPAALGFLKPMVILPAWAMKELSPEELNAILIHELAHLARWDDCTNLAQKILRAFFFFNPAVYWIENRLSLEREMACDDVVLSRTRNPLAYAECLVSLAEKNFARRGIALAQAAVNRVRQTSRRISQILDADRPGATRVWRPTLALVTVLSAASVVAISRAPELIAFQPQDSPLTPVANTVERPQPAVLIPAAFKQSSAPSTANLTQKPVRRTHRFAVQEARRNQPPAMAPIYASSHLENQFATQTVFVVMRTAQYGTPAGSWMLCIWRVTLLNQRSVPSKST